MTAKHLFGAPWWAWTVMATTVLVLLGLGAAGGILVYIVRSGRFLQTFAPIFLDP